MISARVDFARSTPTQQNAIETKRYLGDGQRRNFDGIGQVSPRVVSQSPHWSLRPREHDRAIEPLERKRKRRRRVRHRVGPVNHDKSIVLRTITRNRQRQFAPLPRPNIGRIQIAKHHRIDVRKPRIFGQLLDERLSIMPRLQMLTALHSNRSTRVDEQNLLRFLHLRSFTSCPSAPNAHRLGDLRIFFRLGKWELELDKMRCPSDSIRFDRDIEKSHRFDVPNRRQTLSLYICFYLHFYAHIAK